MNIESLIRPNIQKMKPYSSARDEFSGSGSIFLDANENPVDTGINRYPDPYHTEVRTMLAGLKKISPENIFLGNGSDEPIDLLIRLFCTPGNDAILTIDPTYGMYQVAAAVNDIEVIKAPLTEDFELSANEVLQRITERVKIIFLCSPNNPSGNLLERTGVLQILEQFHGIVVIDEAYSDFAGADDSYLPLLEKYKNLVVLQTFSKAWGLAGVRVGMAFADKVIISFLNKIKPPYNLSVLSQRAVLEELGTPTRVAAFVAMIKDQRIWLADQLNNLREVEKVFPSDSNFLLVRLAKARALFEYLLSRGIIVRDRTGITHGTDCLRFTIGLPDENRQLIDEIKNFYA